MNAERRDQNSIPWGGSVSIATPEMEMNLVGFGIGPFTPRVDPQLLDGLHRFGGVVHAPSENPANHDVVVVQRCPDDVIAGLRNVAGVARRHEEKLPTLVAVGSGKADVGDRPLPEVVDQANDEPGRNIDDDGA